MPSLTVAVSSIVLAAAALLAFLVWQARQRRRMRRRADPAHDYAVRASWRPTAGKLNFSSYVYMDVDGDGVYGLADRPMAGIMVRFY
ncbi:MAG: hypothetical protein E5V60_24790, partial [Mesorhizobium sp.]